MKALEIILGVLLIIGLFIVAVALIVFGPLAVLWALNTLFALNLGYTLANWAAVLVLSWTINGVHVLGRGKKE